MSITREGSQVDWYVESYKWNSQEEMDYLKRLRESVDWGNPATVYDRVTTLFEAHDDFREKKCVNLIASENVMSPRAKAYLGSNLGFRVCDGPIGRKVFGAGIQYLEELEAICIEASRRLFGAEYVEHRLLSGNMACSAIQFALTGKSDTIMSQSSDMGGDVANGPEGPARYIGFKVAEIPWDQERMNVDLEGFEEAAKRVKPRLVILGAMVMLFPYPLREMSKVAHDLGADVSYDGAHVGALIAGNRFQDPLREGADVLMVNTHKQMGGPPGSLVLTNDREKAEKIAKTTFPFLVQTPYCNKFASLAVSLSELMQYGESYASQIVVNAKKLARELDSKGVPALGKKSGYTESHQIMLDVRGFGGGFKVEDTLTHAFITGSKMPLPGDAWNVRNGIRLGVNEVTRRGMKEKEMKTLAEFISRVLVDGEEPERVGSDVSDFMSDYVKVRYCFDG